jgi:hypothetical protein
MSEQIYWRQSKLEKHTRTYCGIVQEHLHSDLKWLVAIFGSEQAQTTFPIRDKLTGPRKCNDFLIVEAHSVKDGSKMVGIRFVCPWWTTIRIWKTTVWCDSARIQSIETSTLPRNRWSTHLLDGHNCSKSSHANIGARGSVAA